MKQTILGTAGHIDHGKTSLIKALTGIDADRLKEEKERGITIELGFAHMALPGGKRLGIVDVPGHEKFVKNMVAGATGIDLVALVIAADEGVMPQTREHLEICQLLGIRHGLVVLTKIDMAEKEWLDLVREDVREYLENTFLGDAPMVEVSSLTGEGLDHLVEIIDHMVDEVPERDPGHFFRLPIDRVFTMKGFGTVITGTTVSGSLHTGDEVTIYPKPISSRVRGIQVHNEDVEEVHAGLRTAINLQGIEKAIIERGDVLAGKDHLRASYMLDVVVELLSSAPRKIKNRAKVRFHAGTSEIISTIVLLDRDALEPGQRCYAQIRLDRPTAVLRHDRYVLRSYSPVRTIGGGKILNALPRKKKRFSEAVLSEMAVLHKGESPEVIAMFVSLERFEGLAWKDLQFQANLSERALNAVLKPMRAQKRVILYDKERNAFIHASFLQKAREEILETLDKYHRQFPLKLGLSKEEMRSRTAGAKNPKLFNYLINELVTDERIVLEKEVVRLKDHKITLARDQEKTRQEMEKIYLKSGLEPPYFKDIRNQFPGKTGDEVLEMLAKEGALVKIKEDLYFHQRVIEDLKARLRAFLEKNGQVNTPQFKEMTGVSRKYTIPLIEYFDRTRLTVRVGDSRVLRKQA